VRLKTAAVTLAFAAAAAAQPGIGRRGAREAPSQVKPEDLCSLSGTVRTNAGEPLRKATVSLDAEGRGGRPLTVTADASGAFRVTGLEPGRYRVFAEKGGYVRQEYGARGPGRAGTAITLNAGQTVTDIEIKLSPQAVITGRVLDEDGEPVVRAAVYLRKRAYERGQIRWQRSGFANTNDLGEYRLFGIAPGRYLIEASSPLRPGGPGGPPARVPAGLNEPALAPAFFPGVADIQSATQIEVGSGITLAGMDIQLRRVRTYRVSGVVSGLPEGRRGGGVMLAPRGGEDTEAMRHFTPLRDSSGAFEIRGVQPGSYLLTVDIGGPGQAHLSGRVPLDVGSRDVDDVAVAVAPGFPLEGSVKVEGSGGQSLDGVAVILEAAAGGFGGRRAGQVKADGTFRIDDVRADRFTVSVQGLRGNLYLKSAKSGQTDALAYGLDLPPGGAARLDIVLSSEGAQVEGMATDARNEASPGVRVVLHPGAGHPRAAQLVRVTTADPSGRYAFTGIAPGKYYVFALEDYEPGMEMDPDVVSRLRASAETVDLKEGGKESKTVRTAASR